MIKTKPVSTTLVINTPRGCPRNPDEVAGGPVTGTRDGVPRAVRDGVRFRRRIRRAAAQSTTSTSFQKATRSRTMAAVSFGSG
jgi:hypothetical protein